MLGSLFARFLGRRCFIVQPRDPRTPPAGFESLESRCLLSSVPFGPLTVDQMPPVPASILPAAAPAAVEKAGAATKARKPAVWKGPLTITKGGTYTGRWESQDPSVPAIRIQTAQPVIIKNSYIRSKGTLIEVYGFAANVTVTNSYGIGLNPGVAGAYAGRFMDVEGFKNIVITNNDLRNTSGIYLYDYRGNRTGKQTVKVLRNVAKNIEGRIADGAGGWMPGSPDPDYYRQFFQINGVKGLAGAEVGWNQIINLPGQSRVEENINIHGTTGRATSPFKIHDNYIQGAYPADAIDAATYTGGGIMLSDNGSSYIRAYNNQIIGTGHVGLTITSGHDNAFYNNRMVSSGLEADGVTYKSYANVGAVVWNFNSELTFTNNKGYKNTIGWVNATGERNDSWTPDAASFTGNAAMKDPITRATEANELTLWRKKLASGKVKVGVVK